MRGFWAGCGDTVPLAYRAYPHATQSRSAVLRAPSHHGNSYGAREARDQPPTAVLDCLAATVCSVPRGCDPHGVGDAKLIYAAGAPEEPT